MSPTIALLTAATVFAAGIQAAQAGPVWRFTTRRPAARAGPRCFQGDCPFTTSLQVRSRN